MEVFSYKACKALFLSLLVKEVNAERAEYCIDAQSLWLGSQVQSSPTSLPSKCIMATFNVHIYFSCKINTYFVNRPCIIFVYFFISFTAKSLVKHTRWRVPQKESKFKYISILDKKKRQ